jgi:hypothetical protein
LLTGFQQAVEEVRPARRPECQHTTKPISITAIIPCTTQIGGIPGYEPACDDAGENEKSAFNPIWGFSWYFNTESWATGIYQKMTELRVDPWRIAMIDAVARLHGGASDDLFQINPDGVQGKADFSFLVIGDPGEGDASQYSLISRYSELGRRVDVKFLVISSDVIYPAGSMHDYEANFYLPFQGFAKQVYAIPVITTGTTRWKRSMPTFSSPTRRAPR